MIPVALRWEAVAAVGIGVLLVVWAADRLFFSGENAISWAASSVNPMILAFLGICALQLVSLPAGLLEKFSPLTFSDKSESVSILTGGESLVRAAVAYAPAKAAVKLAALAASAAAFFLALNTQTSKPRITGAVSAVVGLGVIESLLTFGRFFSGATDPAAAAEAAGVLVCALPAAAGLYLSLEMRTDRLESGLDGGGGAVKRTVAGVAPESVRPAGVVLFLSAIAIAAGLYLCAPTVGRFAAGLSLLAAALLVFAGKRYKKGGLAYLILALFFMFTLGIGPADRPGSSTAARAVSAAAKDYPLLGVGLGSFADLFPRYAKGRFAPLGDRDARPSTALSKSNIESEKPNVVEPTSLPALVRRSSESEVGSQPPSRFGAELAAETGVLAFAVLLFAAGYLLFRIGRIRYGRRDRHAAAVGTGAGAGLLALILLGLTGPHTLSFAHLLCGGLLAAAAKAAVFRKGRGFSERFFYKKRRFSFPVGVRIAVLAGIAALVTLMVMPLMENREMQGGKPSKRNSHQFNSLLSGAQRAGAIETSLIANPAQPYSWLVLGQVYDGRRADPFAYLENWMPRAGRCFVQAVSYAPVDPEVLLAAADHFVAAAAVSPNPGPERGEAIARFQGYYRRALAVEPSIWRQAADQVWSYFPEEGIVLGIVPAGMDELRDRVLRYIVRKTTN